MYYSAAARSLLLRLGGWLVEQRRLSSPEDIFYLTIKERAEWLAGGLRDWQGVVQARRAERNRHATVRVPDTIQDWKAMVRGTDTPMPMVSQKILHGIPISPGQVVGPVRFVRSMEDWSLVCRGDILVVSVIDPGMAPLFGVASGLVAEMSPRWAGLCHTERSSLASTDCRQWQMSLALQAGLRKAIESAWMRRKERSFLKI